jgi:hypothetical protein
MRGAPEREHIPARLSKVSLENFHVPQGGPSSAIIAGFPGLPLVLRNAEKAVDGEYPMGPNGSIGKPGKVRPALEYIVFSILENKLRLWRKTTTQGS